MMACIFRPYDPRYRRTPYDVVSASVKLELTRQGGRGGKWGHEPWPAEVADHYTAADLFCGHTALRNPRPGAVAGQPGRTLARLRDHRSRRHRLFPRRSPGARRDAEQEP